MWGRGRRTRKKPKSKTKLCFSFRDRKEREAATSPPATSGQQPQTAHPHRDPKGLLECWRRPSAETEMTETQPEPRAKNKSPLAADLPLPRVLTRLQHGSRPPPSAKRAELRWRPPSGRVQQALRSAPGRLRQGHGPSARQIRLLQSLQSDGKSEEASPCTWNSHQNHLEDF